MCRDACCQLAQTPVGLLIGPAIFNFVLVYIFFRAELSGRSRGMPWNPLFIEFSTLVIVTTWKTT